jgi:hypothetical protein
MGLAWQQGPLAPGAAGRVLVPDPLPERMLFAEPLRRRMRVRFGGTWIVDRDDVDLTALTAAEGQTFRPYKGLCSYWDIGDARRAAWAYEDAWTEVDRIAGLISFEPDKVEVHLDGTRLRLEPGQSVIPHGPDRDLTTDELAPGRQA